MTHGLIINFSRHSDVPSIPEMTVLLSSPDVTRTDVNGAFPARISLYAVAI